MPVVVIVLALALGYVVGAAHTTGRFHDRQCTDWLADMRKAVMVSALSPKPKLEAPTIDLRPLASDAEVAMFERELSDASLQ